jgi:gamma-glutamyltranspeptidase / glutathione hydrolase
VITSHVHAMRDEVMAENGVVASGHLLEAELGVEILQKGGNAIDAAVAAAFVAGVVEPMMCGIGGHGFASIYQADTGETEVLNWATKAPRAARPDMYELEGGTGGVFGWPKVKGDAQAKGYLAAGMPGTAGALNEMLQRHGTMSLAEVLQPAIKLATEGFPVDWRTSYYISSCLNDMRRFPALGAIYTKAGLAPLPGNFYTPADRLTLSDLGATLKRIAAEGPDFMYRGDIANQIAAEMAANGGIITAEDLAELEPAVEPEPHWCYRDVTYVTGANPVTVEALNILECFDLKSLGPNHPRFRHLMLEAMRQAWVDCLTYLGALGEGPWEGIRSKAYAQKMAETIDLDRATAKRIPGDPWEYEGGPRPAETKPPSGDVSTGGQHTTEVVTIDSRGSMVSLHISLGELFGSKVVIPGTGIVLGNGMTDFDPRPGQPKSIAPGKRPWKIAASPLMFRDNHPYATICASGGRRIISAALHIMVNLVDFGMGIQEAIESHRVHAEFEEAYVDDRLPESSIIALGKMGHQVVPVHEDYVNGNFGRPAAALIDPKTGKRHAGADPMMSGGAAGY